MLAGDEKWYWRVLNTRAGLEDPTPEGADLETKIALRRQAIQEYLVSFPDRESLLAKLNEVNLAWGDVHDHREVFDRQGSIEGRAVLTDVDDRGGGQPPRHQHAVPVLGRRGRRARPGRLPRRAQLRGARRVARVEPTPTSTSWHRAGVLLQDDEAARLRGEVTGASADRSTS